jgi:hypothetical protein
VRVGCGWGGWGLILSKSHKQQHRAKDDEEHLCVMVPAI